MKHIGIVCEGPTDYIILKGVIDQITGDQNTYVMLQPEDDLTGKYGNGWKGVWKWCNDHASIRKELMKDIQPALDLLVVQMDGDVSRKEKSSHCWCKTTQCAHKGEWNPLACDITPAGRAACPIVLPCLEHDDSIRGYMSHLKGLLITWLKETDDTCIAIPCDSTEAWIVAAYDQIDGIETVEAPWEHIIAHGKYYHSIRISGRKKRVRIFEQFVPTVCENWSKVTELCQSARDFEESLLALV
ncbi:MAG: hypothetical protein ACLTYJ_00940 [Merdibacter sp.]